MQQNLYMLGQLQWTTSVLATRMHANLGDVYTLIAINCVVLSTKCDSYRSSNRIIDNIYGIRY